MLSNCNHPDNRIIADSTYTACYYNTLDINTDDGNHILIIRTQGSHINSKQICIVPLCIIRTQGFHINSKQFCIGIWVLFHLSYSVWSYFPVFAEQTLSFGYQPVLSSNEQMSHFVTFYYLLSSVVSPICRNDHFLPGILSLHPAVPSCILTLFSLIYCRNRRSAAMCYSALNQ